MINSSQLSSNLHHLQIVIIAVWALGSMILATAYLTAKKMVAEKIHWSQCVHVGGPTLGIAAIVLPLTGMVLGNYLILPPFAWWLVMAVLFVMVLAIKVLLGQEALKIGGTRAKAVFDSRSTRQRRRADREAGAAEISPLTGRAEYFGRDIGSGDPFYLNLQDATHILGPGGSGLGKTHDQDLGASIALNAGWSVVGVDPKNDLELALRRKRLADAAGVDFQYFSLRPTGIEELDQHRRAFPIVSYGNAEEATDSFIHSEDWESEHYKSIVERTLSLTCSALLEAATRPNVSLVQTFTAKPSRLAAFIAEILEEIDQGIRRDHGQRVWLESGLDFLDSLTQDQLSGISGLSNRCAKYAERGVREVLVPGDLPWIDLVHGIKNRNVVHFGVDVMAYPNIGPQILAFILSALSAAAGRLIQDRWEGKALALIDEMGALTGTQGKNLLERSRSAGIVTWWSPQSLISVGAVAGIEMLEALKDNCDLIISHRQNSPESAELLAQMAGTEEVIEYTHQEEGTFGRLLGRNSGLRSKRLTDQFRVHPNQIKKLRKGTALARIFH
ncbi:MAG TPA: TraM recognition domain-containing protein [Solirubrobacterales bacterium]|nr:TraM recognition domain-containing protein [Solirubrobacterales bacterium]